MEFLEIPILMKTYEKILYENNNNLRYANLKFHTQFHSIFPV